MEAVLVADIYCRLSLAQMGDTTKVDEQERICREVAARFGWQVGLVHKDNSVSAWKKDRKRPGWDAMLARIEDAQAGAIVVYHGDRLIRQPWDLELLLNLAKSKGIQLASPGGTRDLGNSEDQFILRIEAAMACRESDNISRRTTAGNERRRRQGIVRGGGRGGRAFGFATDGLTQIPGECEAIREAAARITDGESAMAVARDFTARGIVTTVGNPWTYASLRKMLAKPRYAGLMPDGKQEAAWEPVVDRATWDMCCATLRARGERYPGATSQQRHLLSGIAQCGSCGSRMVVHHNGSAGHLLAYACMYKECPRRMHRSMPHLDEFVEAMAVERLASPELAAELARGADPGITAQVISLEQRREEARGQLETLAAHPGLSAETAVRALASFDERISVLRSQMAMPARRRLLGRHLGISLAGLKAEPLAMRRALVAALFTITVLPAQRGPGFDPETVRVESAPDALA